MLCRAGALSWTPSECSYFNTASGLLSSVSAGQLVLPFMSYLGNRRAFEYGATIGAAAYIGQALSWRGASKLQISVQYAVAIFVIQSVPAACVSGSMPPADVYRVATLSDAFKGVCEWFVSVGMLAAAAALDEGDDNQAGNRGDREAAASLALVATL